MTPASPSYTLSCVIPVYNEAPHLAAFLADCAACLARMTPTFEMIVVNDGSSDATHDVVMRLLPHYSLRYIHFSRNFGKEAALSAGLDAARGEAVILMDADYQHPLSLLPDMVALWQGGADMVYGVLATRAHESLAKRLGTKLLYRMLAQSGRFSIPENAGDFRLLDKKVVAALKKMPERNRFMKGLYAWVGFKSVAIPFVPDKRLTGSSSFNFRALKHLALTGLTAFTTLPLRVWSGIGACISLLAVLYALYIVLETLIIGKTVPGWPTLTVGLMFFSGVQLLSIGILGEYLGRMYEEVKQRPLYIVAEDNDHSHMKDSLRNEPPT